MSRLCAFRVPSTYHLGTQGRKHQHANVASRVDGKKDGWLCLLGLHLSA
jgi:hypothetical protein